MTKIAFLGILFLILLLVPNELTIVCFVITMLTLPYTLSNKTQMATIFSLMLFTQTPVNANSFFSSSQFSHGQANQIQMQMQSFMPTGFSSHLLTQSLADDDAHFLVFDQTGHMAATTTYMHVMLPLNFSSFHAQVKAINDSLADLKFKNFYKTFSYSMQDILTNQQQRTVSRLQGRLNKAKAQLVTLESILPFQEPHRDRYTREAYPEPLDPKSDSFLHIDHPHLTRHRRWVYQAITGVVGTFMGLYSAYQLYNIANRMKDVDLTQDLLVHLSSEHNNAIELLSNWLTDTSAALLNYAHINPQIIHSYYDELLIDLEHKLVRLTNTVQQLQHRRLAIDWLDKDQLDLMDRTIQDYTRQKNYMPLTKKPSDYFQLELSYIRNPQGVIALLHVPCTLMDTLLTIYKYIPFPIPIPHKTAHSSLSVAQAINSSFPNNPPVTPTFTPQNRSEALYLVAESDLLAIDKQNRYRLLSQSDLAGCIQRNHVYMCDSLQVLRFNLLETCIGSLFMKNQDGVKTNCKFDRRPLREEVFPLEKNDFLVFTPEPLITQAECPNGTSFRAEFGKTTKLTLPSGCAISLRSHLIQVADKPHIPTPPYVTAWKWDPLSLPSDLLDETPMLDATLANFSNSIAKLTHTSKLSHDIPAIHRNLSQSLTNMNNLTQAIHQIRQDATLDTEFLSHADHHLLKSGSMSSIIFYLTISLVILLAIAFAAFSYRQILMDKLLKTYGHINSYLAPAPNPRSSTTDVELQPPPVAHPRYATNPVLAFKP